MSEIFDAAFWASEHEKYLGEVSPTILKMLFAGAEGGVRLLPEALQALIDWNYFNESAIDFLNAYGLNTLWGITKTTERQVIKSIDSWIKSGKKFPDLVGDLERLAFSKQRAEMIATTEVTRVFAEGNIIAWKSIGFISGKRWMTAYDDLVCPICQPLHGMLVELNSNGFTTETGAEALGLYSPPAHVRCRCWLQPFVSEQLLEDVIAEAR